MSCCLHYMDFHLRQPSMQAGYYCASPTFLDNEIWIKLSHCNQCRACNAIDNKFGE